MTIIIKALRKSLQENKEFQGFSQEIGNLFKDIENNTTYQSMMSRFAPSFFGRQKDEFSSYYQQELTNKTAQGLGEEEAKNKIIDEIKTTILTTLTSDISAVVSNIDAKALEEMINLCKDSAALNSFKEVYFEEVLSSGDSKHFIFAYKMGVRRDEQGKIVANEFDEILTQILMSDKELSSALYGNLTKKTLLRILENAPESAAQYEVIIKHIANNPDKSVYDEEFLLAVAQELITTGYVNVLQEHGDSLGINFKDCRLVENYLGKRDFTMLKAINRAKLPSDEEIIKENAEIDKYYEEQAEKGEAPEVRVKRLTNAEAAAAKIAEIFLNIYKEDSEELDNFMQDIQRLPAEFQAACFGVFINQSVTLKQVQKVMSDFVDAFSKLAPSEREYFFNHVIVKTSLEELVNRREIFAMNDNKKHRERSVEELFFEKILALSDENITREMLFYILDHSGKAVFDLFADSHLIAKDIWADVLQQYNKTEQLQELIKERLQVSSDELLLAILDLVIEQNIENPSLLVNFVESFVKLDKEKSITIEIITKLLAISGGLKELFAKVEKEQVAKYIDAILEAYLRSVKESDREYYSELEGIAELPQKYFSEIMTCIFATGEQKVINSVVFSIKHAEFNEAHRRSIRDSLLFYADRTDSTAQKIITSIFSCGSIEFQREFFSAVVEKNNKDLLDVIANKGSLIRDVKALVKDIYGLENAVKNLASLNDVLIKETLTLILEEGKPLDEFIKNFTQSENISPWLMSRVINELLDYKKINEISKLIGSNEKFAKVTAESYIERIKNVLAEDIVVPNEMAVAIESFAKNDLECLAKLSDKHFQVFLEHLFKASDLAYSDSTAKLKAIRHIVYNIDSLSEESQKFLFSHMLDYQKGSIESFFGFIGMRERFDLSRDIKLIFAKGTEESQKSLAIYLDLLLERKDFASIETIFNSHEFYVLEAIKEMSVEKQMQIFANLPDIGMDLVVNNKGIDAAIKDAVYAGVLDKKVTGVIAKGSQEEKNKALARYAALGDLNAVKALIYEGADIHYRYGKNEFTPLMLATSYNFQAHDLVKDDDIGKYNLETAGLLEEDFKKIERSEGCKHLIKIKSAVVKYLLQKGANVNACSRGGMTAWQINEMEGMTIKEGIAEMYLGDKESAEALLKASTNISYEYARSHRVELFMLRGLTVAINIAKLYCPQTLYIINTSAYTFAMCYMLGTDPVEFLANLPSLGVALISLIPSSYNLLEFSVQKLYQGSKDLSSYAVGEGITSTLFFLPNALGDIYAYGKDKVVTVTSKALEIIIPEQFKTYIAQQQENIWSKLPTLAAILGVYAADRFISNNYFGFIGGNPASITDNALLYGLYLNTTYMGHIRHFAEDYSREYREMQRSLDSAFMIGIYADGRWGGDLQHHLNERSFFVDVDKGFFTTEDLKEKLQSEEISVKDIVNYIDISQKRFIQLEENFKGKKSNSMYLGIRKELIDAHTALIEQLINLNPERYHDEVERANAQVVREIVQKTFAPLKLEMQSSPGAQVDFLGYVSNDALAELESHLQRVSGNIQSVHASREIWQRGFDMLGEAQQALSYYAFDAAVWLDRIRLESISGEEVSREEAIEDALFYGGTTRSFFEAVQNISVINIGFSVGRMAGKALLFTAGIATASLTIETNALIAGLALGGLLLYAAYLCYENRSILGGMQQFTTNITGVAKDTIEGGKYLVEDMSYYVGCAKQQMFEKFQQAQENLTERVNALVSSLQLSAKASYNSLVSMTPIANLGIANCLKLAPLSNTTEVSISA